MRYNVYDGDNLINTIVADRAFAMLYAENTGYRVEPEEPPEMQEYVDPMKALTDENTRLKAQLKLQSEQQSFLEDCLLEMADVVYA